MREPKDFEAVRLGIFSWRETQSSPVFDELDDRQTALLVSALTYHALLARNRIIRSQVFVSQDSRMSLANDESSSDPASTASTIGVVEIAAGEGTADISGHAPIERVIVLPSGDLLPRPSSPPTWRSKALVELERRSPLLGDIVRQRRNTTQRNASDAAVSTRTRAREIPGSPVHSTGTPAVIVGMYWLSPGGAEAWALETVRTIADAALVPVVITDSPGLQELAADQSLARAVVIVLDDSHHPRSDDLVRAIVDFFDVRGAIIHHSNWLYSRLPLLRSLLPSAYIVDSLHVIEWSNGGFPMVAGIADPLIDRHHVISRDLMQYLVGVEGVVANKITFAPLVSLAVRNFVAQSVAPGIEKPAASSGFLTVGFIGRLASQKRPLLFILLLRRLARRSPRGQVRAIIHGDGPLAVEVRALASKLGVLSLIEFRTSVDDVSLTYSQIDVLVVCSQVEGLTLTTLEATVVGVAVLSTDVGAQRELVADDFLLPRAPVRFLRSASRILDAVRVEPSLARGAVQDQRTKLSVLAGSGDAATWLSETIEVWTR